MWPDGSQKVTVVNNVRDPLKNKHQFQSVALFVTLGVMLKHNAFWNQIYIHTIYLLLFCLTLFLF